MFIMCRCIVVAPLAAMLAAPAVCRAAAAGHMAREFLNATTPAKK
jgi:hypothetical protein